MNWIRQNDISIELNHEWSTINETCSCAKIQHGLFVRRTDKFFLNTHDRHYTNFLYFEVICKYAV